MSTVGADVEQLGSLKGNDSDRQTQVVEELTSAIRNQIGNTWWQGPAASGSASLGREYEPALRRLQEALQEAVDRGQPAPRGAMQAGG